MLLALWRHRRHFACDVVSLRATSQPLDRTCQSGPVTIHSNLWNRIPSEIACPFSLKLHKWLSEITWNKIFRYIDVLIDINLITGRACAEVTHAAHAPCTYAILERKFSCDFKGSRSRLYAISEVRVYSSRHDSCSQQPY